MSRLIAKNFKTPQKVSHRSDNDDDKTGDFQVAVFKVRFKQIPKKLRSYLNKPTLIRVLNAAIFSEVLCIKLRNMNNDSSLMCIKFHNKKRHP